MTPKPLCLEDDIDMNTWIVIGNTCSEPEVRYAQSGTCVARLRIAVNRYAGKDGQETDFFTLTAFGKIAETLEKCMIQKGTKIAATCEIRNDAYTDRNGNKVQNFNFVITHFEFCGGRKEPSAGHAYARGRSEAPYPDSFQGVPYDDGGMPFN
jgi:single-strand DNA-binding protein